MERPMRKVKVFPAISMFALATAAVMALSSVGPTMINAQTAATAIPTMAATRAAKAIPPFPAKPIDLRVIDVAGALQLVRGMIDNYAKANPDKIASVSY